MSGVKRLPGGLQVEVVGESFYEAALAEIVGPSDEDFGQTLLWASLVPDSDNPYDRNAVKIVINGKQVGHLSREAAIAFYPVAQRIRALGCDAQVAASIRGHAGLYGVVLDLGTPEACLKELK